MFASGCASEVKWHGTPEEQVNDHAYRVVILFNRFAGESVLDEKVEEDISILKTKYGYSSCNYYPEFPGQETDNSVPFIISCK